MITTIFSVALGLIWLFLGLVSTQLVWNTLPNEKGDLRYEWSLFLIPIQLFLVLLGPVTVYLYMSRVATNKILAFNGKTAIRADRERLLNAIYEKAIEEDMSIADIGKMNVEDLELGSDMPTLLGNLK